MRKANTAWDTNKTLKGDDLKNTDEKPVDSEYIKLALGRNSEMIKMSLKSCVHCSLCADSCFLYRNSGGNPKFIPGYKMLNSIGRMYRSRARLTRKDFEEIKMVLWNSRCVLCMRCYCPMGIDIPYFLGLARTICYSQGVAPDYEKSVLEDVFSETN